MRVIIAPGSIYLHKQHFKKIKYVIISLQNCFNRSTTVVDSNIGNADFEHQ